MKVQVFAILKDHFEKEFTVENTVHNTEELKEMLTHMCPSAASILNSCRFAVNEAFIDKDFKLDSNDTIAIIPPGSGG
jgi:molybdopterin synthase sulfur carrier subunit